jgi:hypothetical protein
MSSHCQLSGLGPFRLRSFSAQMATQSHTHGDESNPVEINVSCAMKGLATGLTPLGAPHLSFVHASPVTESWVKRRSNLGHQLTTALASLHIAPQCRSQRSCAGQLYIAQLGVAIGSSVHCTAAFACTQQSTSVCAAFWEYNAGDS